jgi:hypothetical protein
MRPQCFAAVCSANGHIKRKRVELTQEDQIKAVNALRKDEGETAIDTANGEEGREPLW